jgi:quercetin dioxygenase-like cupin family protein
MRAMPSDSGRSAQRRNAIAAPRPSWLPRQPRAGSLRDALRLYPVARKLPLKFSPTRLAGDLAAIPEGWWTGHLGPFHDGGWESVSLWAPRGDMREQRSFGGIFAATPALEACRYFSEVLDAFPGKRNRVRLMRLKAGARILRHSDPIHTVSRELTRIHVPVVTSPDIVFLVNDTVIPLRAGEAWHIDVRFPHQVENRSDRDRVHLVIDLISNAALQSLLDRSTSAGHGLLLGYFVRHSLPVAVKRWLNIGN